MVADPLHFYFQLDQCPDPSSIADSQPNRAAGITVTERWFSVNPETGKPSDIGLASATV